jgi:hypothetical protein
MVRPESVAVVPLILLDLFLNSRNRRYALNMSAALVLVYCMLVAPWLIYARATFGSFLPNTASGKAGLQIHLPNLLATAWDIIKTMGATEACSLVVLLAAGVALFVTRNRTPANPAPHDAHGGEGAEDEDGDFFILRQVALCLGWIIILPLLYLLMDVNVVSRYLLLVTPFVTLLAFSLAHRLANRQMGRHAYSLVFVITTCVMLQNQIFYHRYVVPGITAFEQGMESCLIPVATWLKENAAPGSRVLVGDVGALGYYSNLPVCDAAGLITPSMLKLIHEGNLPYEIIEKKLYRGLCDVDYVVDRALVPEQMKNDKDLFPMVSRPFVGLTLDDPGVRYYTVYKVLKK